MKILVVGSGGREHTLSWACANSDHNPSITCLPGNGGTKSIADNANINSDSIIDIVSFIRQQRFDLTIIGPEAPLVQGLTDQLEKYGFRHFGPSSSAARLEGSKAFSKQVMVKAGIPTADFRVFSVMSEAEKYIRSVGGRIVVKASGLAAGKGALVCDTIEEALAAAEGMLVRDAFGASGREIVIEERLYGREVSLLAIVDHSDFILLPVSRDHKRAFDNDEGPNTGGMGAYSPLPDLAPNQVIDIAKRIYPPILNEMLEVGTPYQGCLYAGVILTPDGFQVLEFNCRLGDPEAQAVLPLVPEDALELMLETSNGNLKDWMRRKGLHSYSWLDNPAIKSAVTVVAASEGYPGSYAKGVEITSLPTESDSVIPFHAGTSFSDGHYYTSGGRVLAITGIGDTIDDAAWHAYEGINQVHFKGITYRRDIGRRIIK